MDSATWEDVFGEPVWPSPESLDALFRSWAEKRPRTVAVRTTGTSLKGRAIRSLELTDPDVDGDDKQHVLVTALHAGVERSGTSTICALIEWLLSDDPEARETLRRQRIVCVPVPDPDNYVIGKHGPVYASWTVDGPSQPDSMPEGVAIQGIIDSLQPDVHADIHGMSLGFAAYGMLENSGASYSNLALQPYHREICALMDEEALKAGYCSDRHADDAELLYWGAELEHMSDRLWVGRPRFYAALYAYHHLHTMTLASEVGWEESGVARHRALLRLGNGTYPGEKVAGYPTRVVASNYYHMVTAYGETESARRRSRIELWRERGRLSWGMVDPNVVGRATFLCATDPEAGRRWLSAPDVPSWLAGLAAHPDVSIDPLMAFFEGWPAGQNGPRPMLAVSNARDKMSREPIAHGLCLRLRLFYQDARIEELLVNGKPVLASDTDGFSVWHARGMTFVQIAIPPQRSRTEDLFIVTCRYDPGVDRPRWNVDEALGRARA